MVYFPNNEKLVTYNVFVDDQLVGFIEKGTRIVIDLTRCASIAHIVDGVLVARNEEHWPELNDKIPSIIKDPIIRQYHDGTFKIIS